jgi:hypothetical protein
MLENLDIGQKDMSRGLFRVWESIFSVPSAKDFKKISYAMNTTSSSDDGSGGDRGISASLDVIHVSNRTLNWAVGDSNSSRHVSRLLDMISASGDTEKILQGNSPS